MTDNIYETIIIGAGCAGLNAARFLKKKALILDKKPEIGIPVQCGEGISILALDREGIALNEDWIACRITLVKRIMPNHTYIGEMHSNPYAVILKKSKFEKCLSGLVNWEIRLNGKVDHLTKEENFWKIQTETGDIFYSRYVIGADGPNSFVAKKVFGKKHILIPAINYSTDFENQVPDNALQMYFGNQIAPFGYGWFFPTSKNCANVGLLLKDKTGNIKKYYSDFLEAVIRPLYGNFKLKENKSGALPINGFSMPVMKENVFLAGDAGAFTDPIFEGGINMALLTGRLAAESINKDNPQYFHDKIAGLPFTGKDLVLAQKIFYGLDDGTLNELGDVLNQNGTSFLNTREGMEAFLSKPSLVKHKEDIFQFAKIWNSAKSYIW